MKYTLQFRIWHWVNAVIVLGLLGTVFLRKTFLSWRTNSEILMTQLGEMGTEITQAQAKILAKAVRAGMWEWHIILGYALAALILFRIYLYFKDSSEKKKFPALEPRNKARYILYYLFYAAVTFMAVSGLVIHFHESLSLSKEFAKEVAEIHEFVYNAILIFVVVHVAGVIVSESREENGLISSMFNGKA